MKIYGFPACFIIFSALAPSVVSAQAPDSLPLVKSALPGPIYGVSPSLRNADRPTIRDYAPAGIVGNAYSTVILATPAPNAATLFANGTVQVGMHVLADGLPASAVVSGIGVPTSETVNAVMASATLPDTSQSLLTNSQGMSTALKFDELLVIPVGASVSGTGIAQGTTVVAGKGNTIYISHAVSREIPAGTAIHFTFPTEPVYFSANWTAAPRSGREIGFYTQDDYLAFANAAWWNDPANGGAGAKIYVPGGVYYLSKVVYTRNDTSFELAPGVRFIDGSAPIDAADGSFTRYSQVSFLGSGYNQAPTTVNISQVLYQRNVPDIQGQALLVAQNNSDCVNDGSGWGCGMVGTEVKQSMNRYVRRGAMWEYHGTDVLDPGQHLSWAGLEAEIVNNSGWWGAFAGNSLNGNGIGLHIDNIAPGTTSVANAYALDPAGSWHTMAQCESSILDWCLSHTNGLFSNQQPMQDSGTDSKGRVFGSQFIAMQTAPDTASGTAAATGVVAAAARTAEVNNDGTIGAKSLNTPVIDNRTSGLKSIIIEDGGRFNAPVSLAIGTPPQGGRQATASVATYRLRAVQGAVAINATHHSNAPDGVTAGMVFSLPGGRCMTQPQVIYDGTEFIVSQSGSCSTIPTATTPAGMKRTQLTLSYLSGGTGTPSTLPVIEPLYGIQSIRITESGTGYNDAVPPDILVKTSFSNNTWTGIIYTPAHLKAVLGNTPTAHPITLAASLKMAQLPKACTAGQFIFVADARNSGEAPGAGTGALSYCTTTGKWYANGLPAQN
ncbi:hypothetical protein [Acetobacter fallax]|uniref:Pectate lyase superfamily protein domain-containing protein n=1 Tax=Acetobacter fallax TaxID=1737473 RepID=A0ABX0K9R2_9PROT|nr:hypothetical protein [Acetobacter fallax]NHO33124.1 hypothetical protein [Acetobacter fallax]NHO36728.1 hypothetical protein [Acetobacter fallax]